MVTELNVRNTSQQLYLRALSQVWRNGVQVYEPSVWLQRDPEAEEKMLRDPDIAHAVGYRRHLIAGRQWQIQPRRQSPRAPVAVMVATELLESIKRFTEARFKLARAFFSGARYGRIHGDFRKLTLGDGKARWWWVPVRIEDVDKRFYRIVPRLDGADLSATWEKWDIPSMNWVPLTVQESAQIIKHTYNDDQNSLGYGQALREALGWVWYAKTNVAQETLLAVERYAGGILRARVNGARDAATGLPNEELIEAWTSKLENLRARHVLVHDSEDEVEVIQGNDGGSAVLDTMRAELRSAVFTLVLGANLTTGADKGGSYALAEVQENSTEALVQYDREILEESLTDDLLGAVWFRNHPNLVELGIAEEKPRFSITQEKREDPEKRANVANILHTMGVALPLDEVMEQSGFRVPEAGEAVVEGGSPAPPPAPGGPSAQFGLQFYTPHVPAGRPDGGEFMPGHGKGKPPERSLAPEDRPSSKPSKGQKTTPSKKATPSKQAIPPQQAAQPQGKAPKAGKGAAAPTGAAGDIGKRPPGTTFKPTVGNLVHTMDPDGNAVNGTVKKTFVDKGERYVKVETEAGDSFVVRAAQVGRLDNMDTPHLVGSDSAPLQLSSAELSAVIQYTSNGYVAMNNALRGEVSRMDEETKKRVALIDAAIARNIIGEGTLSMPLSDTPVFRGARLSHFGVKSIDDLKKGMTIGNHGFISTSKDIEVARSFAGSVGSGVMMKIKTTANSRGLDVDAVSANKGESEVILARNSKFRVVGIDRKHKDGYIGGGAYVPVILVEHIDPHDEGGETK